MIDLKQEHEVIEKRQKRKMCVVHLIVSVFIVAMFLEIALRYSTLDHSYPLIIFNA